MGFNPHGYVIAEAGTGHMGDVDKARDLVRAAAEAGAGAVKFQWFVPNEPLFCPYKGDEMRVHRWNKSALDIVEWRGVKMLAESLGIDFLVSTFQKSAVEMYASLNPVAYKVASRAAKTFPYSEVPGPFIISTGMGVPFGNDWLGKSYLLQCVSEYPVPLSSAAFDADYGWDGLSDHSGTPWPAIDALARGADIIEVHVGEKEGPDSAVNLTFDELKLICDFRSALKEMRDGPARSDGD